MDQIFSVNIPSPKVTVFLDGHQCLVFQHRLWYSIILKTGSDKLQQKRPVMPIRRPGEFNLRALRLFTYAVSAVLLTSLRINAGVVETDHILLAAEHIPATSRSAALGGSGTALADGLSCVLLNPSLFHSYNVGVSAGIVSSIMYGTGEERFGKHLMTASAGARLLEALSLGVVYRYLKASADSSMDNQVVLNVSGRLFDRSLTEGMVNAGINIRYEKLSWTESLLDTLYSISYLSAQKSDTSLSGGHAERRRLALDIGLYQKDLGEGLDFGVTFHNVLGYSWSQESPTRIDRDTVIHDTLNPAATVDSILVSEYAAGTSSYNLWQKKYCRRLTAGIAFHKEVLEGKAEILLPFDLEIFNFLDFKTHQHFSVRTGMEVCISGKYSLRFGYARAPEAYPELMDDLKNGNIFSGGAGLRISRFGADLYIRQRAWGLAGTLTF
jgi:hypothetical protein